MIPLCFMDQQTRHTHFHIYPCLICSRPHHQVHLFYTTSAPLPVREPQLSCPLGLLGNNGKHRVVYAC